MPSVPMLMDVKRRLEKFRYHCEGVLMINLTYRCVFAGFFVFLSGCSPYIPGMIDEATGEYHVLRGIPEKAIRAYQPFSAIDHVSFVYLLSYSTSNDEEFEKTYRETLRNLGFKNVLNRDEFSRLIIQTGLAPLVSSTTDMVSLHRAAQSLPAFIIVEAKSVQTTSAAHRQNLVALDPMSGEAMLDIQHERLIWRSLEGELTLPMLNILVQWANDSRSNSSAVGIDL